MADEAPVTPEVASTTSNDQPVGFFSQTPEAPQTEGNGGEPVDFRSQIPEQHRDSPLLKNINDMGSLVDQFVNAQSLIGRKGLPTPDASFEDKLKMLDTMGRPKDAAGYDLQFEAVEGEDAQKLASAYQGDLKDLFYRTGLTTEQASMLHGEFDKILDKHYPIQSAEAKQEDFIKQTDKLWGQKADSVVQTATEVLKQLVPEDKWPAFEGLPNDTQIAVVELANSISDKFLTEDGTPHSTPGMGSTVPRTESSIRSELQSTIKKQQEISRTNTMSPEVGELQNKISALSAELNRVRKTS